MSNNGIRVSELDFDTIKGNLKTFLKQQDSFKDYDFEASGISTLLDILAYNTHYNAVLTNYQANEMFLDSALRYDSVVSLAKNLGYTAKSRRGAITTVNITLTNVPGDLASVYLPPGRRFSTTVNDVDLVFTNQFSSVAYLSAGKYVFSDIQLIEGEFFQHRFPPVTLNDNEKFILPNAFPDTTTIRVKMFSSPADTVGTTWLQASDILNIDELSNVFFVQPTWDNKYEIYFGDGTIGKKLSIGHIIQVSYVTTSGAPGNGAVKFRMGGSIAGSSSIAVTALSTSRGGEDIEPIDKIKFNAQTTFGAQNRAVTADDYRGIIRNTLSGVQDVITFGGEEHVPPLYGTVCISVIPFRGDFITQTEQTAIVSVLNTKAVANTKYKFIDPVYLNVIMSSNVYYDPSALSVSPIQLVAEVKQNIINFAGDYLNRFNKVCKYSSIVTQVDQTNNAITSNDTTLAVYYNLVPNIYGEAAYSFSIYNQINPGILSTYFTVNGITESVRFKNFGTSLHLFTAANTIVRRDVGTIVTKTGTININGIVINSYQGNAIRFYMSTVNKDIIGTKTMVLKLNPDDIEITPLLDNR